MTEQGWISVHRKLRESWLYNEKPFDKTHAWLDLLLSANHQDNKVLLGSQLVNVKKGSFITSELKLMDKWGWSKTKLRNFLKLLQSDGMIEVITDKKKTTINIVNYCVYQQSENHEKTIEKPQENHEETTKEPQEDTNNNDNNDNTSNNDNKDIIVLTIEEEMFLSVLKSIPNYPLDREKDRDFFNILKDRYPQLDIIQSIKDWAIYKKDKPLKTKDNPRSQINNSFKKYVEWRNNKKGAGNSGDNKYNGDIDKEYRESGIGL